MIRHGSELILLLYFFLIFFLQFLLCCKEEWSRYPDSNNFTCLWPELRINSFSVFVQHIYLYIIYIIYSLTRNFRWVSLSVFPHPSQWLTYRTHNVLRLQNTQSPWYSRYPNSSFLIPSSNAVCIPPWLFIQGSFPWTTAVVREVGVLGRRSCCNREVTICWLSC